MQAFGNAISGLIAAGTTQATALGLSSAVNHVETVPAGTGVRLPFAQPGDEVLVYNGGSESLVVYPPLGGAINSASANAGVTVPVACESRFVKQAGTTAWSVSSGVAGTALTAAEIAAGLTESDIDTNYADLPIIDLRRYGLAEGATGATNREALEAAIAVAGQLGGAILQVPPGTFTIDATVTIDQNYVFIKGSVASATIWQFNPAGTDVLFHFTRGASIIYFCGISNCKFYSANSQVKTAVLVEDGNNFTAEYLVISTGGWAGTGSTGLYFKGRDAANIHRNLINCERPLVIGVNPNYATLHCDHFRIQNNEFGCLATDGMCIEFENGVNLTSHWITNNAFTQGNYAIYASNTTNASAWYGCNWAHNRYEQSANTTGYGIYAYNSAGQIQLLQIDDWYIGPDTGDNVTHGGILVGPSGNVQRVRIRNVDYVGTGEALNVPFSSSLTDVHWTGCKWRVGCTMTLTNGVAQYEGTYNAAQMQFPHEAQYVYNGGALISRAVQRFDGMKVFHYEATVADDGQLNLPCTAALGVEAAMFRAVAVTGSTIAYAHGGWIPGTAPDIYGTASLVSNSSVDGDLCVINNSNGLSVINRLGGEASIAIVVEMVD